MGADLDSPTGAAPEMGIFDFRPEDYAQAYQQRGYVHIPGGAGGDFLKYAIAFSEAKLACDGQLENWQFQGKKAQLLMEFPEESDFPTGLYRAVAAVTGLDPQRMMIGERHVKIYEPNAPAFPAPHKDRLASQVTVGVGLKIPAESRLILYPDHHLELNPYMSTHEWRESLDPHELPERLLRDLEPVEIDMRPGDVVMFAGSSIYHERIRPANTWVLYMKFNALRLDPICEDPQTLPQRARSLELLRSRSDAELLELRVEVSPRLEKVSRHYTRLHWQEVIQGSILGEKPFVLSELELRALRIVDAGLPRLREVILALGFPLQRILEPLPMFRRLAELGALDFHG